MYGVPPGQLIIALEGTIETIFNHVSYATPIGIYLPLTYPFMPPTAILRPTIDMVIIPSINVSNIGIITLPYLSEWNPQSSSIVELIGFMASIFSQHPPLRKAPPSYTTNNPNTPNPQYNIPNNNNNNAFGIPNTMNNNNNMNYRPTNPIAQQQQPLYNNNNNMTNNNNYYPRPTIPTANTVVPSNNNMYNNTNNYINPANSNMINNNNNSINNTNNRIPPPSTQIHRMNSETAVEDSFREALTQLLKTELKEKFIEMRDNIDNWTEAKDKLILREKTMKNAIAALTERTNALRKYKLDAQNSMISIQQWLDIWDPKPFLNTTNQDNHNSKEPLEDDVASIRTGSSYGMNDNTNTAASNPMVSGGRSTISNNIGGRNKPTSTTSSTGLYLPNGMRLDDFIIPATVLQTQLIDAVAEDAAIEDLYTWVGTAADEGRLPPDALVKEIRELARRQFRARYMARKIDSVLTEDVQHLMALQVQYGNGNSASSFSYPNMNNNNNNNNAINSNWNGYPSRK